MKKFLLLTATAFSITSAVNAQIAMPQPSPMQQVRQDFGMGKIELTYSRPSMKGRTMFGETSDLAPAGKLWRTGANAATRIRFTDQVTIGGQTIDTGSYSIFTIPGKNEWEIILNKNVNASVNEYSKAQDAIRVKARTEKLGNKVETFTIQFDNITAESLDMQMLWGNTVVRVPISTNIKDRLRAQIEKGLEGERKPFFAAANFYYEYDKNYAKALENIDRAIETNNNAFWMYMLKARIQKEMGDKAGARTTAQQVVRIATEAKNDDYVRMANDFMKKM